MTTVPAAQMPQMKKFTITDIKYIHDKMGAVQFYVAFTTNQTTIKTATSRKREKLSPTWAESLSLDVPDASTLKITVYARNMIGSEFLAGESEDTIESLVSLGTVDLKLRKRGLTGILEPRERCIMFKISEDPASLAGGQLQLASSNVVPGPTSADTNALEVKKAKDTVQNLHAAPWESLIRKAGQFSSFVEAISQVHPYTKIAYKILLGAHEIMLTQINRDDGIKELVQILDEVYTFLQVAEGLKSKPILASEAQLNVLVLISQQITECAYFIQEYARDSGFGMRLVKNIGSEANSIIQEYKNKFSELKLAFQGLAQIEIEIAVFQVIGKVNDLAINADLQDMLYSKGATFNPDKGCLPNTRLAIINEIVEWATSSTDSHKIYWLSGVAGSGKSAIAHSVAERLDDQKCLGSFYAFDATNQVDRTPQHLFSTISRDLADFSSEWETALRNVIKGNTSLRSDPSIGRQFKNFLLKPSESLIMVGPILLVIDALDECGDPNTRDKLLLILSQETLQLPENFRILITSRPEKDIVDAFQNQAYILQKNTDRIKDTNTDIGKFIDLQLEKQKKSLEKKWPNRLWHSKMVAKSEGLFQWAATACLFIKRNGSSPAEDLESLLSSQGNNLDALYFTILKNIFDIKDTGIMNNVRSILGKVLALKEPLSLFAICQLLHPHHEEDTIKAVLQPLGSLLSGVTEEDISIRPLHASFQDFLRSKNRSKIFCIDLTQDNEDYWILSSNYEKQLEIQYV
ncbi:hypothetical protein Hypma_013220 [Hypsizygus marmoreus]|uniref:Uncharacterized protein n=1 Tax=Hypsizygus marmoreus TaxID=39966 RepID=A0A369JC92_HYPMA|nr:hypothetical protein Hypma_013220 [Hypsizygus marmoreus]